MHEVLVALQYCIAWRRRLVTGRLSASCERSARAPSTTCCASGGACRPITFEMSCTLLAAFSCSSGFGAGARKSSLHGAQEPWRGTWCSRVGPAIVWQELCLEGRYRRLRAQSRRRAKARRAPPFRPAQCHIIGSSICGLRLCEPAPLHNVLPVVRVEECLPASRQIRAPVHRAHLGVAVCIPL